MGTLGAEERYGRESSHPPCSGTHAWTAERAAGRGRSPLQPGRVGLHNCLTEVRGWGLDSLP